jgi:hypothetical protein
VVTGAAVRVLLSRVTRALVRSREPTQEGASPALRCCSGEPQRAGGERGGEEGSWSSLPPASSACEAALEAGHLLRTAQAWRCVNGSDGG